MATEIGCPTLIHCDSWLQRKNSVLVDPEEEVSSSTTEESEGKASDEIEVEFDGFDQ
jgi:hypothetical protein